MGTANLAGTLSAHGLIDEYRFAVNPVLLGGGTPVALAGSARSELDLADTRVFGSGIVEMRCVPRRLPRTGDSYPVTRLGSGPRSASSGLPSGLPSPVVTRFGRLSRR